MIGADLALLAGSVQVEELERILDKLMGEQSRDPLDSAVVSEFRLLVQGGEFGIEGRSLGVVSEGFARDKAAALRREGHRVGVERRRLLRGDWKPLDT